jgi:TPP-dependent pyruvate/acetoin dehydrogenase alpha subunit
VVMAVVSKRSRSDGPVGTGGLDETVLRGMYRAMLLTRSIEERGHSLYRQGRIPGSFYTGRGNEAAAVGVAWAMGPDDVGAPTQRDLGVHVVRGLAPWRILAQYLGRSEGPTGGRDGNVHLGDVGLGTLTMVSHLPAMLPVAVGCALAFRVRDERRVALGWFGDGGSARGDAHEAMNFAGVRRLPVVFVLDNNGFAYSTPSHLEYGITHLAERAAAYGFGGRVVDGTDVVAVYQAAEEAIERARAGGGPTLLELVTLRMEGHAVHDDAFYVPPELLAAWRERDPIALLRARLLALGGAYDAAADEALCSEVAAEVDAAVERALASPWPDPESLTDGVYR